jgi:Predicted integral membrane protein
MLSVWAFLVILYLYKFDRLMYSLTVFPILIVMFNFRLLENYLMYWPIITLATFPYMFREKADATGARQSLHMSSGVRDKFRKHVLRNADLRKIYHLAIVVLLVVVVCTPIYALIQNEHVYDQKILIESATISGINGNGFTNSMMINVSYGKDVSNTSFNFRILEDGFLNNPNGLFWNSTMQVNNVTGGFTVYHLYTNDSANYLALNNSYIIIAYNRYVETWYHLTIGHSLLI